MEGGETKKLSNWVRNFELLRRQVKLNRSLDTNRSLVTFLASLLIFLLEITLCGNLISYRYIIMQVQFQLPCFVKSLMAKEMSCFEVLDVLFWGLKASPVAWTSFMEA